MQNMQIINHILDFSKAFRIIHMKWLYVGLPFINMVVSGNS